MQQVDFEDQLAELIEAAAVTLPWSGVILGLELGLQKCRQEIDETLEQAYDDPSMMLERGQ